MRDSSQLIMYSGKCADAKIEEQQMFRQMRDEGRKGSSAYMDQTVDFSGNTSCYVTSDIKVLQLSTLLTYCVISLCCWQFLNNIIQFL